jgi:hypothetical protein
LTARAAPAAQVRNAKENGTDQVIVIVMIMVVVAIVMVFVVVADMGAEFGRYTTKAETRDDN